MGEAKRRKRTGASADARATADYDTVAEQGRHFVVKHILKTTTSLMLRRVNKRLMAIDPSGKLLCAYYQHMRDGFDHGMARKGVGRSDADVAAAFDRDLSLWLAKGPRQIIREFDERMRTESFGLPTGTPTH
jgi:hypothetical protein